MKLASRPFWLVIGLLAVGVVAALLAEKLWVGNRTVYFDDCRKSLALQSRLRAADVPFQLVERGGISIGRVDEKVLAARLGLPSLLDVPPDPTASCE